jgi:hypothetical protein
MNPLNPRNLTILNKIQQIITTIYVHLYNFSKNVSPHRPLYPL